MKLFCLFLFIMVYNSNGFYVPGVAPVEFKFGEPIEVRAVKMTSVLTQLPYEYYSLPFCKPKNRTIYKSENLGMFHKGVFIFKFWVYLGRNNFRIFFHGSPYYAQICEPKIAPDYL